MNFRVTGSLELFEDDIVHSRSGIDKSSRDDRQRTAFLDVSRRTKEPLWTLQCIRIDTTGEDLARWRNDCVVCTCETSDRVKENNDVALMLDEAFRFFDHHVSDLNVPRRRFVERRRDDLAL